jgi:hypothetical protein
MTIEPNRPVGRAGLLLAASFLLVAISASGQSKTGKQSETGKGKTGLEVVSVSMKVMKSEEYVAFVSWKVVVKNHASRDLRLFGTVTFLDSEGYEVTGDDFLGDIDGGEEKTFTGEVPFQPDDLGKVASIKAKVRQR